MPRDNWAEQGDLGYKLYLSSCCKAACVALRSAHGNEPCQKVRIVAFLGHYQDLSLQLQGGLRTWWLKIIKFLSVATRGAANVVGAQEGHKSHAPEPTVMMYCGC